MPLWLLTLMLLNVHHNVMAAEDNTNPNNEDKQRVPTEELIEGITSSDGRWFEIEVIIFERTHQQNTREQFKQPIQSLHQAKQWNLIPKILQPDISLLVDALPICWQQLDPFHEDNDKLVESASAEDFFQLYQLYQSLIAEEWVFTDELCKMPSEQLSAFWTMIENPTFLSKQTQRHIPIDNIPTQIVGGDHDDFHSVYVIDQHNLQLTEHFQTLTINRSTQPLLHIGWRFPGRSERKAQAFYLIAGKNYTEDYYYDGQPKQPFEEQANKMNQEMGIADKEGNLADSRNSISQYDPIETEKSNLALFMAQLEQGAKIDFINNSLIIPEDNPFPDETWTLDGYIKVHLNHYLYLDTELNYRLEASKEINPKAFLHDSLMAKSNQSSPSASSIMVNTIQQEANIESDLIASDQPVNTNNLVNIKYLQHFPLKQRRRSYSGDIHYIDHPKIGILFQIRKYRH